MNVGDESGGAGGFDSYGQTAEFRAVVAVAEAFRGEFGVSIDAHPGGEGNEAGVVNRAFRATARVILRGNVSPGADLAALLTWTLRQVAFRRLVELGVEDGLAEGLLDSESGLGDRWTANLALAPATVIEDNLRATE